MRRKHLFRWKIPMPSITSNKFPWNVRVFWKSLFSPRGLAWCRLKAQMCCSTHIPLSLSLSHVQSKQSSGDSSHLLSSALDQNDWSCRISPEKSACLHCIPLFSSSSLLSSSISRDMKYDILSQVRALFVLSYDVPVMYLMAVWLTQ